MLVVYVYLQLILMESREWMMKINPVKQDTKCLGLCQLFEWHSIGRQAWVQTDFLGFLARLQVSMCDRSLITAVHKVQILPGDAFFKGFWCAPGFFRDFLKKFLDFPVFITGAGFLVFGGRHPGCSRLFNTIKHKPISRITISRTHKMHPKPFMIYIQ